MLNYANLNDVEFEALCKDIMERKLKVALRRFAPGRDGGVDLTDDVSTKSVVVSGVINWFLNCAYTIANRKGHLLSDMAGSFSSATKRNEGMGLPGSFLSTMKELSMLPIFADTDFAENLRKPTM